MEQKFKFEDGILENKDINNVINTIMLYYIKHNTKKNEKISLKKFIGLFEKTVIYTVMDIANGNQKITADILGIRATTLNEKLKRYDFNSCDFKMNLLTKVENKLRAIK